MYAQDYFKFFFLSYSRTVFFKPKGELFCSYNWKFKRWDFQLGSILGTKIMSLRLNFCIHLRKIVSLSGRMVTGRYQFTNTRGRGVLKLFPLQLRIVKAVLFSEFLFILVHTLLESWHYSNIMFTWRHHYKF